MNDRISILVVDDLPDKLLALQVVLADLGCNVVTAQSGREALRRLLERDFAVILLDVNMPEMDGFETAALIRQHKRCARTPIIFVTAFSDDMHASRGYSLGAVDYILSPVVPEVLRTKVGVFVDLFEKTEQVRRHAEERIALEREQAARMAVLEANRRLAFLAEASTVLASSLDENVIQQGLTRLAVPFLADFAFVTLCSEQQSLGRTEWAWNDPERGVGTLSKAEAADLPAGLLEALRRVTANGKAECLSDVSDWQPPTGGAEPAAAWQGPHRVRSVGLWPLRSGNRLLGAMGLGMFGRPYAPEQLALAEDLAKRTAVALDNARLYRNIQAADRRKDEFLAMLSHELRNPLAPIFNGLQILRLSRPDDPERLEAQAMMERQIRQLARIVDGLLDVFRIAHNKVTLHRETLDLADLVRTTVEDHRRALLDNQLTCSLSLPADPVWVLADRTRLAQVLSNVLQNAIKFTNAGGSVAASITADARSQRAAVSFRDTGIGIAPEVLPHVFETFTQADRSLDRNRGGLGLGLAMVKGIVELHGGGVRAASAGLEQGTEVGFWLPLGEPPPRTVSAAPVATASAAPVRVLIVEDNRDTAKTLCTLLKRYGHEVAAVHSGSAGVAAARGWRPHVILCDLGLPEMDGYEVAAALRQDPATATMRLIAVTGYGQEEDRQRSEKAGFDLHLTKPVDPAELQRLLATFAGGR